MNLNGKILIAMPGMGDLRFEHSVVVVCQHGKEGAMGLIVNKPAEDVHLSDLLTQLEIGTKPGIGDMAVHFGGPVENARGFVLHSDDYESNLHSMEIEGGLRMTATLDILEDIAAGTGPKKAMIMLGYAGWGPGQLEAEISMNGWLTADTDTSLVFDVADGEKWKIALKSLGVDPLTLSASAGHA